MPNKVETHATQGSLVALALMACRTEPMGDKVGCLFLGGMVHTCLPAIANPLGADSHGACAPLSHIQMLSSGCSPPSAWQLLVHGVLSNVQRVQQLYSIPAHPAGLCQNMSSAGRKQVCERAAPLTRVHMWLSLGHHYTALLLLQVTGCCYRGSDGSQGTPLGASPSAFVLQ